MKAVVHTYMVIIQEITLVVTGFFLCYISQGLKSWFIQAIKTQLWAYKKHWTHWNWWIWSSSQV